MYALLALLLLALLIAGLLRRRSEKRAYAREELLDESGGWIDKRAGERGTFGSLDAERERQGQERSRQGRITELVQRVRAFAFEQIPGFHQRSDAQLKSFNESLRQQATQLIDHLENLIAGQTPPEPRSTANPDVDPALAGILHKEVLDFAYRHYPALLDLELEAIRQVDRLVSAWAADLLRGA